MTSARIQSRATRRAASAGSPPVHASYFDFEDLAYAALRTI